MPPTPAVPPTPVGFGLRLYAASSQLVNGKLFVAVLFQNTNNNTQVDLPIYVFPTGKVPDGAAPLRADPIPIQSPTPIVTGAINYNNNGYVYYYNNPLYVYGADSNINTAYGLYVGGQLISPTGEVFGNNNNTKSYAQVGDFSTLSALTVGNNAKIGQPFVVGV